MSDPARTLLRHTIATVAYRGNKACADCDASFGEYRADATSRTPVEILAHIGDLYDWALSIARGAQKWNNAKPLAWDDERARFFASLKAFDDFLASDEPIAAPMEQLFQGPIADSLTHIGQIAMLRRMSGAKMNGENYFKAEVVTGRVGAEQAKPKQPF